MIVREQLLVANSRANTDRVLAIVGVDPELLAQLMVCFLGDEVRVAQRAAQVAGGFGRRSPEFLLNSKWIAKCRLFATNFFAELNRILARRLLLVQAFWMLNGNRLQLP